MSLSDALIQMTSTGGSPCIFRRILDALPKQDAEVASELLHTRQVSPEKLARILSDNGHRVSGTMVRRHWKEECSCPSTKS